MAKIDHLGIAVKSIEQARRLYEALGLTVLEEEEEEEGVRSVMIPLGESRLRLLEPLHDERPSAGFLNSMEKACTTWRSTWTTFRARSKR